MDKIVLAFSGGVDTTCIIPWLKDNYNNCQIVAFCANLGETEDEEIIKQRAMDAGASEFYFKDLREIFVEEYVLPALRAGAQYEGEYLLATALARPLIAKELVSVARQTGADAIAHGCTGKGNDQVRFELGITTLAPDLEVIAPVRVWDFKSREEEIDYIASHGLKIDDTGGGKYSLDRNLWGISVECGELEDPWIEPPADSYVIINPVENTPDTPEIITVRYEAGRPVSLNGEEMPAVELIEKLNRIGAEHGVGRFDMVENRVVGIKSREVYEAPAGRILFDALRAIETLVLEKDEMHNKRKLAMEYGRLTYEGKWFSPLRESIQAACDISRDLLSGEVRIKLFKAKSTIIGRRSDKSMYVENLATYTDKDEFSHNSAKGFIELWGLPLKVWGSLRKKGDEL